MRTWEAAIPTTRNTSVWARILERRVASGRMELQGCLVLEKSHDINILASVGSVSANKHRISYIYSTAGKMIRLEPHQAVKWLHQTVSESNHAACDAA